MQYGNVSLHGERSNHYRLVRWSCEMRSYIFERHFQIDIVGKISEDNFSRSFWLHLIFMLQFSGTHTVTVRILR